MLLFATYTDGKPSETVNLSGAYVVGSDDVALRADISFKNGVISCEKRSAGPAGLAMLCRVPGVGEILLDTVRLQERSKPYTLQVELARGRLLRINQKIEEWSLLDLEQAEPVLLEVGKARDLLIKAMQADTEPEMAALAERSLGVAVLASEQLAGISAEVSLKKRRMTGGMARRSFGCSVHLDKPCELSRKLLADTFDFVNLPIEWRNVEPAEQTFNWKRLDAWVETLTKQRIPINGSSLLSFNPRHIPDWLYVWENDFDTIRDLAFQHMRRVISRYGQYIQSWEVVSGIHAGSCFTFNFEQLMELTRMAAALVKQSAPRSAAIVDLVAPWGEYYARNQRTIPPLLYGDMVVQSGVNFDGFGLQFLFGPGVDGMFVRDLFQISGLLDQFSKLGKPLHVSAVVAPSDTAPEKGRPPLNGGVWHEPWSEGVQADWLQQFFIVALSKSNVESVCWQTLTDHKDQPVPHGGLLRSDLAPKEAYERLKRFRTELLGSRKQPRR